MQSGQVHFANERNGLLDSDPSFSEDASISRIHQFLVVIPTCAASLSLCIYAAQLLRRHSQRNQEGAIRLPEDSVDNGRIGTIRLEDDTEHEHKELDVWDIQDEEMEIDGYPIEEEAFWRKVRLTSIVMGFSVIVLIVTVIMLDSIQKGRPYAITARSHPGQSVLSRILSVAAK
jgi:hypothetical protein